MAAGPITRRFPGPGLPWRSGVPAAGSQAPGSWEPLHTRVRPWQEKYQLPEEQGLSIECPRHLCELNRAKGRTEKDAHSNQYRRGGFHKEGEGPSFGDSFPDFSSGRNRAQRSVPGWGADLRLGNRRRSGFLLLSLPGERARQGPVAAATGPCNGKRENYRLLDLRQMCIASAAAISSSRNWGAATEIRPSARSQVVLPLTLNMPCSVTT